MTDTIEQKCLAKGVKLTEQRRTIARVISESKKIMVSQTTQMWMNFTNEFQILIAK